MTGTVDAPRRVESAAASGGRPSRTPVHLLDMRIRAGLVASAMAVLLLVMSELDTLVGDVLDAGGRSWPAQRLMGVGIGSFDGWQATFPQFATERTGWLTAYLIADLLFIALYVFAARTAKRMSWRSLAIVVTVMGGADVVEDVLALVALHLPQPPPSPMVACIVFATLVKSISGLVAVINVVHRFITNFTFRGRVVRWLRAIYRQGFSLLVLLPLAVLSVLPGNDLLNQLPDVERRWLLAEPVGHFYEQPGLRHATAAVVSVAVVAVALFVMGRLRSSTVIQRAAGEVSNAQLADLRLALLGPAVILVAYVIIWWRGAQDWQIHGLLVGPFVAFACIPLVIAGLSMLIRCMQWKHGGCASGGFYSGCFPKPEWHVRDNDEKAYIVRAGDLIATWSIVVAALGPIRSYTPVLALARDDPQSNATWVWAMVWWFAGCIVALVAWPLSRWLSQVLTTDRDTVETSTATDAPTETGGTLARVRALMTPSTRTTPRLALRIGLVGVGVLLLLAIGLNPEWFAENAGVISIAAVALLAGCLVIGGIVVLLEDRLSPELFWFRVTKSRPSHQGTTPVTAIILIAVIATWTFGSTADVHGLRGLRGVDSKPAADLTARPNMPSLFADWSAATAACATTAQVNGGPITSVNVRPMFLVASEGGGIRAAYWAAASLDILSGSAVIDPVNEHIAWGKGTPTACSRPLLAAGASGGSVGLTVARFSATSSARERVLKMAAPDALGVATVGLFVRDLVYSATGLPVYGRPAQTSGKPGSAVWRDRAALMQDAWTTAAGLSMPFLPADQKDAANSITGALVLNSTRVADGCRAWVSQIDLTVPPGTMCDSPQAPSGHTVDLFKELWRTPTKEGQYCIGSMTAATAAMLTARFPFVTPSGVAGPCGEDPEEQQFVDGGYVENSGIKTLIDLSPLWLAEVQRHNQEALRTPTPDLIVPVVVYQDNGTGSDLVVDPPEPTPEPLVPQRAKTRAGFALVDTPSLLRDVELRVASSSIVPGGPELDPVRRAVDAWRVHSVFLIQQSTFPAVTAPLGWVLSQYSIETMDRALYAQAVNKQPGVGNAAVTKRGTLRDALALVKQVP